jgi:SWI/SNF-related matrix-associated actin-dependent regulator 1 of chromatin subfamily A
MQQNLFPYQLEGVEYLLKHRHVLLADQMGLGKSLQALTALVQSGRPGIILCPAYLKGMWAGEIKKFYPNMPHTIAMKSSQIPNKIDGVLVCNYEQLDRVAGLIDSECAMIIDEAHMLKSMKAKRTKLLHERIKKTPPKFLWLLTGTPIKNRVPEFYSLLLVLSYSDANNGLNIRTKFKSFAGFCRNFCFETIKRVPGGMMLTEYSGLKNALELKEYLKYKYIRRETKDVLDLPDENHITMPIAKIEGEDALRFAWEAHERGKIERQEETVTPIKVQVAIQKTEYTAAVVRELINGECGPVVVFSDHVAPLKAMVGHFKDLRTAIITGEVAMTKRTEIVASFQAGQLDVIFCSIGAASVGITLTRSCQMIFNDLPWVPGDLDQARKRILRIGQAHPCYYRYVVADGIDAKIAKTLQEKSKIIQELLI